MYHKNITFTISPSNSELLKLSSAFKTLNDSVDGTKGKLTFFNKDWNTYKNNWQQGYSQSGITGGIASVFKSNTQVVSRDQIEILRNWNSAVEHGCTRQQTFNRIIANADDTTKLYFSGLKKGKGSVEGLKQAQEAAKTSTLRLTIAQTALNMVLSVGFMAVLSMVIKGLDQLANSTKRASEAADKAFNDTSDKVKKNEEEAKSLDELISKYQDLKKNENLDIDGRKEIKEVQNDIADLVGTQAKNLDLVNGKLDNELSKLNQISKKEAKNAYETATANYSNAQKAKNKATGDSSYLFMDGYAYVGKREKTTENVLANAGFKKNNTFAIGGFFGDRLMIDDSHDNNGKLLKGAQEKADYLQSMIDVLEQNGQRASNLYAGLISQRDKYLKYIDNQQDAANSLVSSWISYNQFSNNEISKINVNSLDTFEQYRQKMIDEAKKDDSIGEMLADGTLSNDDLEKAINDFMATSTKFSTWYEQWIKDTQNISKAKPIKVSFSFAWKELGDSTKKSLLELAEAGNLTKETFLKVEGSSDFLTKLGLSEKDIDKVINKINKLVDNSKQLSTMRSGISSITSAYDEKKDSKYNTVSASTLSSMYDTLGIKEWDKENIKAWENYKEIAGDSAQSLSSLAKAQNKLASAYVNSHDFLSGLTKETQDYYEAQLTEMGVTNAHEVTTQVLANKMQYLAEQKAYAKKEGEELSKASTKNLKNFIDEQGGANKVSAALFNLAVNKEMVNNHALNFDGDVSNLLSYVEAIEGANKALNALKALKAIQHGDNDTAAKLGYHYMDTSSMSKLVGDAKKEVNKAKNKLKTNTTKVNPTVSLGNKNNSSKDSSNKSKSKDKTKPTAQIFDFIERRINKLTKTIDYAKAKIEALFTVKAKNSQLDTALKNTTNLINAQKKAANKYQAYADKLAKNATKGKKGLRQSEVNKYIKLIENGSLTKEAISSIKNEKLKTFIENYQTYHDKAQEAKKAVQENIVSIVELNKQKLDNITSYYDALISKIDATTSKLEAQISLQKSVNSVYGKGEIASADTYDKLISNTSSDITQYKSEKKTYDSTRKSARNKLEKELKKNGVSKSERKAALADFDATTKAQVENFNTSIFNAESKLYEYAQSLASLPWDKASAKVDKLSSSYDILNAKLSNGTSVDGKNTILNQMNKNLDSQLSQKKSALTDDNKNIKDTAKWLNKKTKIKVKSGQIISQKDLDAIKKKYGNDSKQYAQAVKYNNYVNKRDTDKLDYDKSVEENKTNKAENFKTQFTNIQSDYERSISDIETKADSLENAISVLEAKGYKANANYYKELAQISGDTITKNAGELTALQKKLQEGLDNGTIQVGTDSYYEMVNVIANVKKNIDAATLSQAQYLQKVRETNREIEKSARDAISNLNDEAEFYKDILAYEELYDDNGNLNDAGKATMQLSMTEMSNYIALNNELKQSIADLDEKYAHGEMGFNEYYTQKQSLLSEQQEAIKGYYSECDAIKTLIENGYNAQKEALSDLISKYTEALDAEKNLHDYEKNIKEKTENIDSIKKRIAALQGNDTEEARQKIQKLTIDLKSAQEDLEETQYEQYLSDQKDILDDLQNDYQTFVEEQLKNVQDLINALITDANTNTGAVIDKLDNIAKLWGTDFENNKLKESLETASFGSETNQDANAVKVAEKVYDKFKDDLSEPPTTILAQPPSNDTIANNNNDSEDPDTNSHIKKQQEEEKTKDDIKDKEEKEAENKTHSGAILNSGILKSDSSAIINSDNFKSDKQKEKESLKKIIKNYTGSSDDTNKPLRKVKKGETSKSALNKKLSADYGVVVKSGAGNHGQKYIDMFAKAVGLVGSNGGYGENDEVYQQLKKKYLHLGFSTGGVVGELNKVATDNGDDGWITVKTKERVLTARQNNLWEKWTKNLPELVNIADYLPSMSEYMPKIPDMATNMRVQNGGNSVNVGDISYTMEFPNVTDSASMKEAIKQDTSLQNLMRDVTIGQMKKGNKLGMMKY